MKLGRQRKAAISIYVCRQATGDKKAIYACVKKPKVAGPDETQHLRGTVSPLKGIWRPPGRKNILLTCSHPGAKEQEARGGGGGEVGGGG